MLGAQLRGKTVYYHQKTYETRLNKTVRVGAHASAGFESRTLHEGREAASEAPECICKARARAPGSYQDRRAVEQEQDAPTVLAGD